MHLNVYLVVIDSPDVSCLDGRRRTSRKVCTEDNVDEFPGRVARKVCNAGFSGR